MIAAGTDTCASQRPPTREIGATSAAPSAPGAASSPRNLALDFTKGGLVLCMVVYHTLNYFRYDVNLLRHLHFLPPSFIFIAGFLITHVYLPKTRAGDVRVYRRLFVRGLKTLGLFIALNLAVHSLFSISYNRHLGLRVFANNLDAVFLTGEQRAAVFGVLLPISYLLILSAMLLRASQVSRYALHVFAGSTFLLCVVLAQRGLLVFNLDLLSMGLLGMVVGLVARPHLDRLARSGVLIAIGYLAYSAAVRAWYPTYLMNTLGVCLSLLLLYAVGLRFARRGIVASHVTLLGNYSLLSYLVQIAVLQALFRGFRFFAVLEDNVIVPLLATVVLTLGAVKAVDFLRARTRIVDRAYQAVFA